MTLDELRANCEMMASAGCTKSAAVLMLFDKYEFRRIRINELILEIAARDETIASLKALLDAMTDRCAMQSELLSRAAEREAAN